MGMVIGIIASSILKTVIPPVIQLGVLSQKMIAAYSLSNGVDSKSGLNGAVGSSVTFSAGVNGNGANFNNTTSSFISISDNNAFSFTNGSGTDIPFSISFFVKFNDTTAQWIVNKRGGTSGTDEWSLALSGGKLYFEIYSSINSSEIYTTCNFTPSNSLYYHITVTYNALKVASGQKIYINGVLQTLTHVTVGTYTGVPNGTSPLIIGKRGWVDSGRLNGQLDELYFFNSEISQSEVTQLQTAYFPNV